MTEKYFSSIIYTVANLSMNTSFSAAVPASSVGAAALFIERMGIMPRKPREQRKSQNPFIELLPSTGGRPRKTLTKKGWEMVATMSQFMATDEEIAVALSDDYEQISVDVLTNELNRTTFAEQKLKGKCRGKTSLRSWQFASAKNGNVTMQIFLGKNYLGQSDRAELEVPDTQINITVAAATEEDIESD